jgi:hypothetical protein
MRVSLRWNRSSRVSPRAVFIKADGTRCFVFTRFRYDASPASPPGLFGQFIKMCQNTPQLCWGDEWPTLSPGWERVRVRGK